MGQLESIKKKKKKKPLPARPAFFLSFFLFFLFHLLCLPGHFAAAFCHFFMFLDVSLILSLSLFLSLILLYAYAIFSPLYLFVIVVVICYELPSLLLYPLPYTNKRDLHSYQKLSSLYRVALVNGVDKAMAISCFSSLHLLCFSLVFSIAFFDCRTSRSFCQSGGGRLGTVPLDRHRQEHARPQVESAL